MECYAAIKRNEIMSFAGTWVKLETIILSKQKNRKPKSTHWSLVGGGQGRDSRGWGDWEWITFREIPNIGDGGMKAANQHGMCIPM